MAEFRLPFTDEHTAIVGRNGSGKTQQGWWLLSKAPFDRIPFYILDYKLDDLINSVDRVREVGLHEKLHSYPGLYIVHSQPALKEETNNWLLKLWEHENNGIMVDEMYMCPDDTGLDAILTQGRAKKIPGIFLSQRPVNVPRAVFTESTHLSIFHLQDRRDRKTVSEYTPPGMVDKRLPDYHSYWYNVKADSASERWPYHILRPVPDAASISSVIDERLAAIGERKGFR